MLNFDGLEDEQVIWACVEPILRKTRARSPGVKAKVFQRLNAEQRALFLFQVLHGHAGQGMEGFYAQISYLTANLDFWAALKASMRYFEDAVMLGVVERMEASFPAWQRQEEGPEPLAELNSAYRQALPETLHRIAVCVRANPLAFLSPEESPEE